MNLCLPFDLHIIIIFCFRQATIASMLRKIYTRNDEEVKNMPILTNIGNRIRVDSNKYNKKKKMEKMK